MRNLFCFFPERRRRYKRRSECEFPSDTKEHPSEKNTPSERERIDGVNVNVDEEEEEDKEEEEEELCIFFESRVCRCDFWKNEKRERKTIQTTHQFILLLLVVVVVVFVCRVCVSDTTAKGQTLLFLSLALSPKEREREREREKVYFYSRSNETSFFADFEK